MQIPYSLLNSIPVRILILYLAVFMAGVQAHAQIAFVSDRTGNHEIFVMDADGNNLRNLSRSPAQDYAPK